MFARSRRNLARWFTLSMGGVLITFAGAIYCEAVAGNLEKLDQLLYRKAQVIAANVQYEDCLQRCSLSEKVDLDNLPFLGNASPPPDSELVYARWYNPQRRLLRFFGGNAPEQLEPVPEFQTLHSELRQVTIPVYHGNEIIGYLQLALPLDRVRAEVQQFLFSLMLWLLLSLSLISLVGWLLGGLAMQPIRQAYDNLQRFTSDASHELRTPLAAILSNAQVGMLAPIEQGTPKHQRLEKIAEVAKSMNSLVSNLLFLARRSGRLSSDLLETVNLVELVDQIIKTPSIYNFCRKVTLKTDFPRRDIKIQADPELLSQAIANLIDNACKYSPNDEVVLVRVLVQARHALIQVKDNGVGIPDQDLPHIFDRFYRVSSARCRETGGSGLGLAIALQIVEAHGGFIRVQSQLGQGSLFQIELPLPSL